MLASAVTQTLLPAIRYSESHSQHSSFVPDHQEIWYMLLPLSLSLVVMLINSYRCSCLHSILLVQLHGSKGITVLAIPSTDYMVQNTHLPNTDFSLHVCL
jgi:hypothetical protein